MRYAWALLICAVLGACGDGEPTNFLVVAAGVRQMGGDVQAVVVQPGRQTLVTNEQLLRGPNGTGPEPEIKTANRGPMRVSYTVVKAPGDTIALGAVDFQLTKGNQYSTSAVRRPAGSRYDCFGCGGYLKFPFTGSERGTTDSLWIYFRNAPPLCKGCVY